jgi:low temperature requirement protein LtrA
MQVGRNVFMVWAVRANDSLRRNFLRIGCWLSLSAVFWILGGAAEPQARLGFWALALLIEYSSAWLGFWTPGMGRSTTADWNVSGPHMAERCGLFVIIALGESVLVTGATFAETSWTAGVFAAFSIAFLGSAAMWWIYFNAMAGMGSRIIEQSAEPGRVARIAYTYLHIPIVAGIVLAAVGDELLLAHAMEPADVEAALAIAGGPALYLLGILLFKWSIFGRISSAKALGIAALMALMPLHAAMSALALAGGVLIILAAVAAGETIALARAPAER